MPTRRLDHDDAYTTRFRAPLLGTAEREGRPAVELASTYFYPESGGQEADRGRLGPWRVVDVQSSDDGVVWHLVEPHEASAAAAGEVDAGAEIEGEVDWARRFDHMQQHTGQHVLSAAFEHVLSAPTVSSHLGSERCSIEVGRDDAGWRDIERVERAANAILWRDLPVERHWVDDEGVKRFALRKPPQVQGRIRIVEIPDWDVSACGGTHVRRTGEVGVVKIVRWERVRGNVRFEFLCGERALDDYAWRTESLLESARRRTLKDRELLPHLERAAAERDELRKQVRALEARIVAQEARERVGDPPRGVAEQRDAWPREAVRAFAIQCLEAGAPWAASGAATPDPVIVAGRAKSGGVNLREQVPALLEVTGGKGGGSPDLIQIAPADAAGVERGMRWLADLLRGAPAGAKGGLDGGGSRPAS